MLDTVTDPVQCLHLGDGICTPALNKDWACYDGGDCEAKCYLCQGVLAKGEECPLISNGICNLHLYNLENCFDGGDCGCPKCDQDKRSQIGKPSPNTVGIFVQCHFSGDWFCNAALNHEKCCNDGGDCQFTGSSQMCPSCGHKDSHNLLTNGLCDGPIYTVECCFDMGICLLMSLTLMHG